ncbi:hypothetical protein [Streptomyces sp. CS081A]|uniref:hypothetical protein n=1 Tax=Streptomyces sp. CS081A TaxID=2162709 RepID=UPI000D51B7B3|nr:hypothetical protein [Streptomyces sp. CS081A]PVC73480.1 hypothetical protein DBP18_14120 [Streptomyces sp. CS081A]
MSNKSTAQRIAAYRSELIAAQVPRELADDIVRDAAQTLVMHDGLTVRAIPGVPIVICALNTRQAMQWATEYGLSPRNVHVADHTNLPHGITGFAIVTLPGFNERDDAEKIRTALTAMQDTPQD